VVRLERAAAARLRRGRKLRFGPSSHRRDGAAGPAIRASETQRLAQYLTTLRVLPREGTAFTCSRRPPGQRALSRGARVRRAPGFRRGGPRARLGPRLAEEPRGGPLYPSRGKEGARSSSRAAPDRRDFVWQRTGRRGGRRAGIAACAMVSGSRCERENRPSFRQTRQSQASRAYQRIPPASGHETSPAPRERIRARSRRGSAGDPRPAGVATFRDRKPGYAAGYARRRPATGGSAARTVAISAPRTIREPTPSPGANASAPAARRRLQLPTKYRPVPRPQLLAAPSLPEMYIEVLRERSSGEPRGPPPAPLGALHGRNTRRAIGHERLLEERALSGRGTTARERSALAWQHTQGSSVLREPLVPSAELCEAAAHLAGALEAPKRSFPSRRTLAQAAVRAHTMQPPAVTRLFAERGASSGTETRRRAGRRNIQRPARLDLLGCERGEQQRSFAPLPA